MTDWYLHILQTKLAYMCNADVHTLATLLGTLFQLLINTNIYSASHMVATQCIRHG